MNSLLVNTMEKFLHAKYIEYAFNWQDIFCSFVFLRDSTQKFGKQLDLSVVTMITANCGWFLTLFNSAMRKSFPRNCHLGAGILLKEF